MNTQSRIEIYDSKGEKKVIQPPAGRVFTGGHEGTISTPLVSLVFETRPLPTPREQRDKKLRNVLSNLLRSFGHRADSNGPIMTDARTAIEAIFSEYPDRKENL